jgi:hypothetical protein
MKSNINVNLIMGSIILSIVLNLFFHYVIMDVLSGFTLAIVGILIFGTPIVMMVIYTIRVLEELHFSKLVFYFWFINVMTTNLTFIILFLLSS